jgi:hypothetical protein
MDPPLQNKTAPQVVAAGYDRAAEAYAELETTTAWPRMRWLHKVLAQLFDVVGRPNVLEFI